MKALGMIEIKGFSSSIETLDACLKAADVRLLNYEANFGSVTIKIEGDVGAVRASVDSGVAVAVKYNTLISSHVIAKPDSQVEGIISGEKYIGDKYPPVSQISRNTVEKVRKEKKDPVNYKYVIDADNKEKVNEENSNNKKSFSDLIKESKQKIREEVSEEEIIPVVSDVDEKIIDELEFAQDEKNELDNNEEIVTEPNIIENNEESDVNTEYKNVNSDFIDSDKNEVMVERIEEDNAKNNIEEEIKEEEIQKETEITEEDINEIIPEENQKSDYTKEEITEDIKNNEDNIENIEDEKSDSSVIAPVKKRRDCNYICALCDDLECPDRRE
jgi:microcompartment protein CcmL/EutN